MKQIIQTEWELFITSDQQKLYHSFYKKNQPHQRPLLVFCNGIGSSNLAWKYVMDELESHFSILQIAYRGTIEHTENIDLRLQRHAQDVFELVQEKNWVVFGIVGWSMGVQVALHLATLVHPKVMVLLGGAHKNVTSLILDRSYMWAICKPIVKLGTMQGKWLKRIGNWISKSPKFRSSFVHVGVNLGLMGSNVHHQHFVDLLAEWFEMDLRVASQQLLELDNDIGISDVSALQADSLIICGGKDVLVHQSLSQKLANELLYGVAWHFDTSGHFILLEHRNVERNIKKWLLEKLAKQRL